MLEFLSARNQGWKIERTEYCITPISILTAISCVLWATHQKWHFTRLWFKQASTGHDTFSPVNDADFPIFSLSLKYAQSRLFYESIKISAFNRLAVLFWNHALIASGFMVALCEWLNATIDVIALADVLPDAPADFTIDSITLTLVDWLD